MENTWHAIPYFLPLVNHIFIFCLKSPATSAEFFVCSFGLVLTCVSASQLHKLGKQIACLIWLWLAGNHMECYDEIHFHPYYFLTIPQVHNCWLKLLLFCSLVIAARIGWPVFRLPWNVRAYEHFLCLNEILLPVGVMHTLSEAINLLCVLKRTKTLAGKCERVGWCVGSFYHTFIAQHSNVMALLITLSFIEHVFSLVRSHVSAPAFRHTNSKWDLCVIFLWKEWADVAQYHCYWRLSVRTAAAKTSGNDHKKAVGSGRYYTI